MGISSPFFSSALSLSLFSLFRFILRLIGGMKACLSVLLVKTLNFHEPFSKIRAGYTNGEKGNFKNMHKLAADAVSGKAARI